MSSTTIPPSPEGSFSLANIEEQPDVPPILNVPIELLIKIFEEVIEIPNSGPWGFREPPTVGLQDLACLTRVCKAFRSAAQPVLLRHFDVTWCKEFERIKPPTRFDEKFVYSDTGLFFKFLNSIKKNGSADLVRYLDAHAISNERAFSDWHMYACFRGHPMGGDAELLDGLVGQLGGFKVTDRQHVKLSSPIRNRNRRETTGRSVLLALLLSTFRNVLAARLPVDPGTANLFDRRNKAYFIEDGHNVHRDEKSNRASIDRVFFNWAGLEGNLKSPAFPQLTELELVGNVEKMSHEPVWGTPLMAVHLAYMLNNTPKLKTLRLFGFSWIDLGPSLNLGNITTLVLKGCSVGYPEVNRLATACTKLKTFKISTSSPVYRRRPHIWQGEEGFEETHFGVHIDDVNDMEENPIMRDHDFPHLPWASNVVASSLFLQALAPASQTLENIRIGRCGEVVVDVTKGLNCKRRRMDYAKFELLRDLGIWFENLFLPGKSNDDVFSGIVGDAGRLNCLSIFMREGTYGCTVGGKCVLERALARLALDLESGKVETWLEKIRIFRMPEQKATTTVPLSFVDPDMEESWYNDVATSSRVEWHTTCDLDPATVEKLAEHGIEVVNIGMNPEDAEGDNPHGSLFPNDAEADYLLWDHLL